jgi:hypothetical protein
MPFDKFVDMETLSEERRRAVQESLQNMSVAELRNIVKELSDFEGDPWQSRRKAQSYSTVLAKIPVSGSCPAVGWVHCQSRRNAI